MRFRRPPRCTYCSNHGHTRRSCPTMRERALAAAAKPVSERNWTDDRALSQVEKYKAASSSARSCAYCGNPGHNARGCSTRKDDIIVATERLRTFRKKLVETLEKHGVGIGALISLDGYSAGFGYSETNNPHIMIVRDICAATTTPWEFNGDNRYACVIKTKNLRDLDGSTVRYDTSCPLPVAAIREFLNEPHRILTETVKVLSPAPNIGINVEHFTSYVTCSNMVEVKFAEKWRNKLLNRATLRSNGVIDP